MGGLNNISHDRMPKQGEYLRRRTRVCFHYDTSHAVMGTIVRDDAEPPFQTIIRLDDGRIVLGSECQYSPESHEEAIECGWCAGKGWLAANDPAFTLGAHDNE